MTGPSAHRLVDRYGLIWRPVPDEPDEWETEAGAGLYRSREALESRDGPMRPAPSLETDTEVV